MGEPEHPFETRIGLICDADNKEKKKKAPLASGEIYRRSKDHNVQCKKKDPQIKPAGFSKTLSHQI